VSFYCPVVNNSVNNATNLIFDYMDFFTYICCENNLKIEKKMKKGIDYRNRNKVIYLTAKEIDIIYGCLHFGVIGEEQIVSEIIDKLNQAYYPLKK
tara:strand:+ start:30 stop:317 length:288 start_codon:yes stop_codon:yes gene_type:complete